jgi:DNA-nicking Smr family endonuclease
VTRSVSKADRDLFRRAMADVKPLPPAATPAAPATRPSAPRKSNARSAIGTARPSARNRTPEITALRRGRLPVDATLDLHGLTSEAARRRLREFIAEALSESLRVVRIVHGKGLRSGPGGPVLKALVERELQAHDGVIGSAPARPADGGSGAVVVLLFTGRSRSRAAARR